MARQMPARKSDIVLRFSHAWTDEDADLQNKILLQAQEQSPALFDQPD